MAINISDVFTAAKAIAGVAASHPITKGGSLAVLITGGLYAAMIAGVAIPTWAFTAGPIAGYVLYKLLPPKYETDLDDVATKVVDAATTLPDIESDPSYNIIKNKPNL